MSTISNTLKYSFLPDLSKLRFLSTGSVDKFVTTETSICAEPEHMKALVSYSKYFCIAILIKWSPLDKRHWDILSERLVYLCDEAIKVYSLWGVFAKLHSATFIGNAD